MRLFELSMADGDNVGPVHQAVLATNPLDCSLSDADSGGRRLMRMVFSEGDGQKALDAISTMLEHQDDWRLVVLPVEASLPKQAEEDPEVKKQHRMVALREEIYQDIEAGTKLDRDFLILTALSTIVVVFGLAADNVAAVIGAMVIAPLLGPILAFALGSALGDFELMTKASRTALSGLFLGMAISVVIGLVFDVNLGSTELTSRTIVGLDSTALALASGAAAALSIVAGLPSTLVGVMVAVALLPPAASTGLFAGSGDFPLAARAGLLLMINIVSVNLAALLVFFFKGVRPRTWLERRSAKRSVLINAAVWAVLIVALTLVAVYLTVPGVPEVPGVPRP
ncbi:TIGR00341 family protein [uncultured Maricaulis sp.]|uniref:TIGR00341 family protein n=1 Tax=uncultured Maricaulis sp. TaxID=174710 RepID=UPI0030D97752|tara:strand:+ start:244836 stop:245855 length:1020 start_codon:yes stop_codon:yes gene_type:complete